MEFRLRVAKLYLEEGYSSKLLAEQFGISTHSIHRWVKVFRLHGAAGLEPKRPVTRKGRVAEEVRQQAVEVKREHPEYDPRRIGKDVLTELKLAPGISRVEKNERIGRVLAMITEAKTRYGLPIRILAAEKGLCPAMLRRWRRRLTRGQAAVGRRGPQKVKPLKSPYHRQSRWLEFMSGSKPHGPSG